MQNVSDSSGKLAPSSSSSSDALLLALPWILRETLASASEKGSNLIASSLTSSSSSLSENTANVRKKGSRCKCSTNRTHVDFERSKHHFLQRLNCSLFFEQSSREFCLCLAGRPCSSMQNIRLKRRPWSWALVGKVSLSDCSTSAAELHSKPGHE
eukprot:m.507842 g.507842  ORF g.507842 m.507842 type:complete len:155 (-) comp57388_c0_seq5:101-565(-)